MQVAPHHKGFDRKYEYRISYEEEALLSYRFPPIFMFYQIVDFWRIVRWK